MWRPRRAKRRVAALLAVEVAQNTGLLSLQAAMMQLEPQRFGPGFHLSALVWDAAKTSVTELPESELRDVLLLYGTYESINRDAAVIDGLADEIASRDPNDRQQKVLATQAIGALQLLREQVIDGRRRGHALVLRLRKLGGLVGPDPQLGSDEAYLAQARSLVASRTKLVQG